MSTERLTDQQRTKVRRALKEQGFTRQGSTHDQGDGEYDEIWTLGDNQIVVSWAPMLLPEVAPLDLRVHAVRGLLEPGKRYLQVRRGGGAEPFEVRQPGTLLRRDHWSPGKMDAKVLTRRKSTYGYWDHEEYASDMGLWDVPGVHYQNLYNFVLDLDALHAAGIRVKGFPRG